MTTNAPNCVANPRPRAHCDDERTTRTREPWILHPTIQVSRFASGWLRSASIARPNAAPTACALVTLAPDIYAARYRDVCTEFGQEGGQRSGWAS